MVVAANLQLVVDSTDISRGDSALDKLATTGARVSGSLNVNMGNIEAAMAALGVQIGKLDASMAQMARSAAQSGQASARTFEQLRASIDPAFAATLRYQQVQQELAAMVASGQASQNAANMVLDAAASRYMGVATAAERAAQAQQEAAAAVATGRSAYDSLRASVDPLFAASKRYEAALEAMNAAVKSGAITQQQANQVMKMTEAQLLGIAPKAKAAAAGQQAVAAASRGLFASVGGGQMAMKQMAFQLNQVAQQGAVTGNYMQALSIQSADMLTVFGTWGILAGGVIAVMGPLAMSLLGAGDNTKALKDAMDNLSDSVSHYKDMAERAVSVDLGEEFGRYAGQARDLYGVLRDLGQLKAMADLQKAMAAISEASDSGAARMVSLADTVTAMQAAIARAGTGEFAPDASELAIMQDRLRNATADLKAEFGMTAAEAQGLVQRLNELAGAQGPQEAATAASALNGYLKEVYGSTLNIPPALQELATEAANGNLAALQILSTMDAVTGATNSAAGAAAGLAGNLAGAAAAFNAMSRAQAGIDNGVGAGRGDGLAEWRKRQADAMPGHENMAASGTDMAAAVTKALSAARSGGGGGGGGVDKDLQEAARWFEKTRTEAEKYAETAGRLKDLLDAGKITQDTYNRALKQASEHLDDLDASSKRGVDAVTDLFMALGQGAGEAKRAVANLLLEIAKMQIYKGLAGMAGGGGFFGWLGGLLTSANGNVIANGQHVKAYASGGVVTGPTVFPMRTGAGLMGEAGPEAIMPLTRMSNGKLGVASGRGPQQPIVIQVQANEYFDARVASVSSYGDAQTARMTQRAMPGAIREMQSRGTR